MGGGGPRRGHARRGLRARVRGRHGLARSRFGRGDLGAVLRVRSARDRARQAARRARGRAVPPGVRRALRAVPHARGRRPGTAPVSARPGYAQVSDVTELLQRLIRVDTTNPPGKETAAAELLREYLEANGVVCDLYARVPERANLVARIPGRGSGPSLLLLSHTDVVLAEPGDWQVPPFSGELRDGHVWGRGALDMKGQVAASAVAIASLARERFKPAGDLIFVAAADEEVGPTYGLAWLCEAH